MTDKLIMTAELAERLKTHLAGAIDEVDEADELYQMLQSLTMVQDEPVARMLHSLKPLVTINSDIARSYAEYPYNKHPDVWREGAKLYTSPQALTPLKADDVTAEMLDALNTNTHPASTRAEILATAVNAYLVIKHRSEAK